VASQQGWPRPGGLAEDWLETHPNQGFTQAARTSGPTAFSIAFHDGEEIGPRMLAQIAKRMGLRPEDL